MVTGTPFASAGTPFTVTGTPFTLNLIALNFYSLSNS